MTYVSEQIFDVFEKENFGREVCFLCGEKLNSKNRSDEHVIPKWVQDRFDLWNKKLELLNGTDIPYKKLKIPCCKSCNNNYLSELERKISLATLSDADALRVLDDKMIFQWLSKIFYGLLYREYLLPLDRTSPDSGPIIPKELLKEYKLHHLFMQSIRVPMEFNELPASIFIFDIQNDQDVFDYDFKDDLNLMTISIKLGKIGIIAVLQDGGAQSNIFLDYSEKFFDSTLNIMQFKELTSIIFYKAYLLNRSPKYVITGDNDKIIVLQLPLKGISGVPIYNKWNQKNYAVYLSEVTGLPLEEVFIPPDKTISWLFDENYN